MRRLSQLALMMLVLTLVVICSPCISRAYTGKLQIPPEGITQIITLEDGSKLFGRIVSVGDKTITFKGNMGVINIETDKIKNIEEISASSIKGGEYWFPNPNRSRLLFGPTARSVGKKNGYLFDVFIFFPGLAYGITDNFMVTGGASIIPEVDDQLFYFAPKLSFNAGRQLDVAVSLNVFRLFDQTLYIGLPNMTYGSEDNNFTAGVGFAFTDEEAADNPVGTIGGVYRLSRRLAVVGEGWYIPTSESDGMIGIGGFRFFGEKMALDFGALVVDETDEGSAEEDEDANWIPYIDFIWNF
jgi:hypothetical protein